MFKEGVGNSKRSAMERTGRKSHGGKTENENSRAERSRALNPAAFDPGTVISTCPYCKPKGQPVLAPESDAREEYQIIKGDKTSC